MGRFRPHARNALVESYFSRPLIRLLDVGAYILLAAGLPSEDTRLLEQWGLICDGQLQAIPDDAVVVALASQRASIDTFQLSELGWRKLGWGTRAQEQPQRQQIEAAPLIFVPKALIPQLIPQLIGKPIGCASCEEGQLSPSESAKTEAEGILPTITGTHGESRETSESSPNPLAQSQTPGGRDSSKAKKTRQGSERWDTEAARLLWAIGAHPTSIVELARVPPEQVGAAIAYAQSAPGIVSIAGWVVGALRRHRDEGWPIPKVRKQPGSCIDVEAVLNGPYGDLFRRGSDLSDVANPDVALAPPGGQSCAQAPAPDLVPPGAHTPAQGAAGLPTEAALADAAQADALEVAEAQLAERAGGNTDRTSLVRLWNRVLATMQVQLSRHEFNSWVRRTELLSIASGVVTLSAPSALVKQGLENRYTGLLRGLIQDLFTPVEQVRVVVAAAGGHNVPSIKNG
jgi:hypothetical protein